MGAMPLWVWLIVIGGLTYGLLEVGLREHRETRQRLRRLRAHAERIGFEHDPRSGQRELTGVLVVLRTLAHPGGVSDVFRGRLTDGTPVAVFDFLEFSDDDQPEPRVGFVLRYPTDWPTFELDTPGSSLVPKRRRGDAPIERRGHEHEFTRALLASTLCDYLAAHRGWTFAFTGPYAVGVASRGDGDDLGRLLATAEGLAERLPASVVTDWAADQPPRQRRQAS